jgi:hypothetical protein
MLHAISALCHRRAPARPTSATTRSTIRHRSIPRSPRFITTIILYSPGQSHSIKPYVSSALNVFFLLVNVNEIIRFYLFLINAKLEVISYTVIIENLSIYFIHSKIYLFFFPFFTKDIKTN